MKISHAPWMLVLTLLVAACASSTNSGPKRQIAQFDSRFTSEGPVSEPIPMTSEEIHRWFSPEALGMLSELGEWTSVMVAIKLETEDPSAPEYMLLVTIDDETVPLRARMRTQDGVTAIREIEQLAKVRRYTAEDLEASEAETLGEFIEEQKKGWAADDSAPSVP